MRVLIGFLAMLVLAPIQAQEPSEQESLAWLNYQLAVAEAPGDARSDQRLAWVLDLLSRSALSKEATPEPLSEAMHASLARAEVVAAELNGRVDAARDIDPVLLANDLGCWPKTEDMALCDNRRAKLEAFLPDNAYFGITLMSYAWMREDADAFLRVARVTAAAENYDSVPAIAFRSLVERYRQVPPPAGLAMDAMSRSHPAEVMAMAVSFASTLPPYSNFIQPCRESQGELRDHCLAIATKMMSQGQHLMEVSIGASVVEAIGTADDVAAAKARRLETEWLKAKALPLLQASESVTVAGTDDYLAAFGSEGEIAALRVLLDAHGISRLPPADWTDAQAPFAEKK